MSIPKYSFSIMEHSFWNAFRQMVQEENNKGRRWEVFFFGSGIFGSAGSKKGWCRKNFLTFCTRWGESLGLQVSEDGAWYGACEGKEERIKERSRRELDRDAQQDIRTCQNGFHNMLLLHATTSFAPRRRVLHAQFGTLQSLHTPQNGVRSISLTVLMT